MSQATARAFELPAARLHAKGLWLASAPLVLAASAAAHGCPEALPIAANPRWAAARRSEFLAGRAVAAQALAAAGRRGPVARAEDGTPQWPAGSVGSIAHSAQWAVAAVGHEALWAAIGVDVEPDAPLPADAASLVLQAGDRRALAQAFGREASAQERLVFSAKECVHKAIHPRCGAWLEFEEVETRWALSQADQGSWQALPLTAAADQAFAGQMLQGEWWREGGALWCLLAIGR